MSAQSREQVLIDMMFEIAVRSMVPAGDLRFKTRELAAEFVASQLRELGFRTQRRGISWGVLERVS